MTMHQHHKSAPTPSGGLPLVAPGPLDPVCGMTVNPQRAAGKHVHQGHTYYFCNVSCLRRFQAEPERFLVQKQGADAPRSPETAAPPGTLYTCPMHPEVEQERPGSCPFCGMALEPKTFALEEGPNPELADMTRRFWIGFGLSLPIFVLAMAPMVGLPLHRLAASGNWFQLLLATPVVLWCGWPFFERAWTSVLQRSPNMFTLIALGVGAAYLYSLAATLAPGLFPAGFRGHGGVVEPYFDTAAVVIVLVLLGQLLELRARGQTSSALRRLLGLTPKTARRVQPAGT